MHPTCLNGKACGHNDPLCLISLLLCFSSGLFLGVPKKEGGRKTIAVTAHAASRLHAPEGRRRALTSTIQTRSTVNTGTLHRTAALHGKCPVSVINRKEVGDSRLSPGVSAGRSETAPGFSTVTHSAGDTISARDTIPQGIPLRRGLHCIGYCSPLLYSASEEAAAGAGYKTRVAFVIIRKGYHRIGCRL